MFRRCRQLGATTFMVALLAILFVGLLFSPSSSRNSRVVDASSSTSAATSSSTCSTSSSSTCSLAADDDEAPEMTWKAWVAIVIVMGVLVVLTFELISVTAAMVGSSVLLWLTTIISLSDMFVGFVNGGVISIVLFFIIVRPLSDLPLVQLMISKSLSGGRNYPRFPLFKICALSMLLSSLLDNIPQVAMFTPLVKEYCRMERLPPSQFLMPMAFAVLLGNYALIGASNNLVVDGLMEDAGMDSMSFFELIKITGVASLFGLAYLVFAPRFLLPLNKGGMFQLVEEKGRTFLMQIRVRKESVLIGTKTEDLSSEFPSLGDGDVDLIEIDRGTHQITHFSGQEILQEGDILVLSGAVSTIVASLQTLGLDYHFESDLQYQRQDTEAVIDNLEAEGVDPEGVINTPQQRTPQRSPRPEGDGEDDIKDEADASPPVDLDNEPFDFAEVGRQTTAEPAINGGNRNSGEEMATNGPENNTVEKKKLSVQDASSNGSPLLSEPYGEEANAPALTAGGGDTTNEPIIEPSTPSNVPTTSALHHSNKLHQNKHPRFKDGELELQKHDQHNPIGISPSARSEESGSPRFPNLMTPKSVLSNGGSGSPSFPHPSRSASYLSHASADPELTNMSFMRQHTATFEEDQISFDGTGGSFTFARSMSFLAQTGGSFGHHSDDQIPAPQRTMSFSRGNAQYVESSRMYEVVLSGDCPAVGTTLAAGAFTHRYNVTLMALRTSQGAKDLTGLSMMSHQLATGDTLLVMAPKTFGDEWRGSFDFLMVSEFSDRKEFVLKENFFTLPHWSPIGRPLGRGEKAAKVIKVPVWYPYLSLAAFMGVVIAAIIGAELHAAAMIAVCFLLCIGIMDTKQAVSYIDWNSLLMVAFSFGLGKAVSKSGLADVVGYYIIKAAITGFPLLLVISFATAGLANIVTNKAAAQVMFPIVYQVYSGSGLDPLPGVMVLAAVSVMPFMTPHGIASNVMVMGPGGYTPKDYLKFGAPLQLMMSIIIPLNAAIVYSSF